MCLQRGVAHADVVLDQGFTTRRRREDNRPVWRSTPVTSASAVGRRPANGVPGHHREQGLRCPAAGRDAGFSTESAVPPWW